MSGYNFILWLLLAIQSAATPLAGLEPVGTARLKVMFWTIYDSTLFTKDGIYDGVEADLALRIEYRRKISSNKFIEATREQWQELGIYQEEKSESWITQLGGMFPDVKKGDVLTLYIDQNIFSNFYFNGIFIGTIDEPDFSEDFLSIWLAANSSYPELRAQLVGLSN